MSSDTERSKRTVHVPPKFNLRGRRQLWFVEGVPCENFLNGVLSALVTFGPLALLVVVVVV